MQTVWKGSISFGLVSIPVRLVAATEENDVSFRQVHAADGGRIRYKRICDNGKDDGNRAGRPLGGKSFRRIRGDDDFHL